VANPDPSASVSRAEFAVGRRSVVCKARGRVTASALALGVLRAGASTVWDGVSPICDRSPLEVSLPRVTDGLADARGCLALGVVRAGVSPICDRGPLGASLPRVAAGLADARGCSDLRAGDTSPPWFEPIPATWVASCEPGGSEDDSAVRSKPWSGWTRAVGDRVADMAGSTVAPVTPSCETEASARTRPLPWSAGGVEARLAESCAGLAGFFSAEVSRDGTPSGPGRSPKDGHPGGDGLPSAGATRATAAPSKRGPRGRLASGAGLRFTEPWAIDRIRRWTLAATANLFDVRDRVGVGSGWVAVGPVRPDVAAPSCAGDREASVGRRSWGSVSAPGAS